MSLTENIIKSILPQCRPFKRFDKHGLYIEVLPNGRKYWRFRYWFRGKEKRISFGIYPKISLETARYFRDSARKTLSNEIDPSKTFKPWRIKTKVPDEKYLIDIDKTLKGIPEDERDSFRMLFENHNEKLKEEHKHKSLFRSLLALPPSKAFDELYLNTPEICSENVNITDHVVRFLKDEDLSKILSEIPDGDAATKFVFAHITANKDYSKSREEINKQKNIVSNFKTDIKKIRDTLSKIKKKNIQVPAIIDTCLVTIEKYFDEYQFVKDPVLGAAICKRENNRKTQYLRALSITLQKSNINLNENILNLSYELAYEVLQYNNIFLEKEEFRKTLKEYFV